MKETRCRKHPADLTSSIGVCATCLRQRLFTIIASQNSQQQQQQSHPLPFPRSVSPYISRRKSDTSTWQQHHQQTPLVLNPTTTTTTTKTKKAVNRLSSLFLSLFGSKSKKSDPDPITKTRIRNFSIGRGMSPARCSDAGEEITSGFSSVMRTPARVGNISSAFCLSPLVRPSPNRRAFATETCSSSYSSHLSNAPSFCKNRSRKLADIGRCNFNHNLNY